MNICHIAPFAPNRCGLYESSRDLARADIEAGNNVFFIDAGVTENGIRKKGIVGAVDDRAGFKLETADIRLINYSDIIVMHTGCNDNWIVKNQSPIVWIVHGRPLACFKPELSNNNDSFSLYAEISRWQRTKKMIYFWNDFNDYWENIIPKEKLLCLDYPVIDENRFQKNGNVHTLKNSGKYNFLVCDSEREDIGLYELVNGCIQAAKKYPNKFKFHFFGFDMPIPKCWDLLLNKLKELGALGDLCGRVSNMELVYRACDCLISPNRIITRTIGEALSCAIPVIAQNGTSEVIDYTCDMALTHDLVEAIELFVNDFDSRIIDKNEIVERSKVFNMSNYSKKMNELYEEITR